MQHTKSVFVHYEGNGFTVRGKVKAIDIPRNVTGQVTMLLAGKIYAKR
jgi:hypothetical protein